MYKSLCLVMSFWLKVCIYSHTRGVKLGLGFGFMQTSQVLPHLTESIIFFLNLVLSPIRTVIVSQGDVSDFHHIQGSW